MVHKNKKSTSATGGMTSTIRTPIIARLSKKVKHFAHQVLQFIRENPIHVLIGTLVVVISAAIIFSLCALYLSNHYLGEQVTIANLSEYTRGRPTDRDTLAYIQHDLYRAISSNLTVDLDANQPIPDPAKLTDILVRDGSFSQIDNDETGLHTVTFIVDIASLEQSYRVSYQWLTAKNNSTDQTDNPINYDPNTATDLSEYGTMVSCLDATEVIYPNFNCRDALAIENANTDPISAYLPYRSQYFDITLLPATTDDEDGYTPQPRLQVTLFVYLYETDYDNREATAETIKPAVLHWLTAKGFNPEDYDITYEIEVV